MPQLHNTSIVPRGLFDFRGNPMAVVMTSACLALAPAASARAGDRILGTSGVSQVEGAAGGG